MTGSVVAASRNHDDDRPTKATLLLTNTYYTYTRSSNSSNTMPYYEYEL